MAGRLYRMAKVVSANPASWGIVDANQISGFRTVATQADLYSIAACILSSSYGDGTTTGADAVGQIWHVQDTNKDFRLTSWANRGKAAGWTEELTSESLVGKINAAENKADSAINKANTNSAAITDVKSTANNNALKIKANADSISELKTAVGKKADSSRVDIIADSVNSNTGDIVDIKSKLAKKADLVNGKLNPEQLPDIDTTLYELAPNNTLPSTLADINKNHIYLVKADTAGTNNVYAEYIYTGTSATYDATKWEKLGEVTASVDLSGYYTKTDADKKITSEINKHRINTIGFVPATDGTDDLQLKLTEYQGEKVGPTTIPTVTTNTNGLMSTAMLTKLNGLTNYTHPSRKSTASGEDGLYKITVDELGHVSKTTAVDKSDIASLAPDLTMTPKYSNINVSVIAHYNGDDKTATIAEASNDNAGVMSTSMYAKLHAIADGATRNEVKNEVTATGTDAVSGKAVYTAINTHKLTDSNLSSTAIGNTYSILGECDSETNEIGALTDSLMYQYSAEHSTLSIDGAAVWDEVTLKAISNDELTKILV